MTTNLDDLNRQERIFIGSQATIDEFQFKQNYLVLNTTDKEFYRATKDGLGSESGVLEKVSASATTTPKSVTFVVDASGGDYPTLQEALDALPTEGGRIALREGTYALSSTLTLPNKPVTIQGMGSRATKISLGSSAIAAFTIPSGVTAQTDYTFLDLEIEGTNVTGQKAVVTASSPTTAEIYCDRVEFDALDTVFDVSALVSVGNCLSTVKKLINNQSGSVLRIENSIFSFTENSAIIINPATSCQFIHSSFNVSGITGYEIKFNLARVELCTFTNGKISVAAANSSIASSRLRGDGTNTILTVTGARMVVMGCEFENAPTGIDTSGGEGVYANNVFQNQTTPILESGAANNNVIIGNRIQNSNPNTILGSKTKVDNQNVESVSVDTTLNINHHTVLVDASGGSKVITLPTAASARYRVYTIKKDDSSGNTVTIDGDGSETIDGATTQVLSTQHASLMIQSTGSKWIILAKN